MTFINYTCIYIYRPICIRVCPSRIDFFFVWQMRLWILQMVCDALITCNNLIFVPCDCSGSVFANLLLPIMLLNINGCQRFLALFYAVFPIMEGIKLSRKCRHAFVISCAWFFFYYIENSKHQVILCYVNLTQCYSNYQFMIPNNNVWFFFFFLLCEDVRKVPLDSGHVP